MKIAIKNIKHISEFRLVIRSLIFISTIVLYLQQPQWINEGIQGKGTGAIYIGVIWILLVWEMASKIFPSPIESLGSEKQFLREYQPRNYDKQKLKEEKKREDKRALLVIVLWMLANCAFYAGKALGFLDDGMMVMISMFYTVMDMLCILVYCPFQKWFIKNRCCITCRIYNWDQFFIVTPFLFMGGFYAVTASILGIIAILLWEYRWHTYTERFLEQSNAHLSCGTCGQRYGCAACLFNKKKS